jgi:hypothetical protein
MLCGIFLFKHYMRGKGELSNRASYNTVRATRSSNMRGWNVQFA